MFSYFSSITNDRFGTLSAFERFNMSTHVPMLFSDPPGNLLPLVGSGRCSGGGDDGGNGSVGGGCGRGRKFTISVLSFVCRKNVLPFQCGFRRNRYPCLIRPTADQYTYT